MLEMQKIEHCYFIPSVHQRPGNENSVPRNSYQPRLCTGELSDTTSHLTKLEERRQAMPQVTSCLS